ncbi:ParA family protein [Hymenobacter psychrophilus]|uniref:Chromosome partitioning protein n=1 Tax=Hymenobacter psychrophilus TaxID=651662 RepID=A0A1H3P5U0_9BACT|nr:ParA family protein [Hymenobacter psychrophilus]SDY96165.1 chromosome partitioning protein [Hymenobacter psychrophilus]
MEVYSFANRKGGVSKTSSVWAVGQLLAQAGQRVLLIDADAQASLTRCLPVVDSTKSLAAVMDSKAQLLDVMQQVGEKLWLVAATEELVVAEKVLGADLAYPLFFKKAFKGLNKLVDYVLIDTPPAPSSPLTVAALTASTKVFVPTSPEVFSFDGVTSLLELVTKIQDSYNPELEVGGVFLTKYSPTYRRGLHHAFVKKMRERFGSLVMTTTIRENVAIPEAQVQRQSLQQTAAGSNAFIDYTALTKEILSRQ